MVEIPDDVANQAALTCGQAVKWASNGEQSIALTKKTVTDGLLEIENRASIQNEYEEHLLELVKRAESGDLDAQTFLGMSSRDAMESAKWLRLAAEQGDRYSMEILGRLFLDGDGIEKNIANGYFWLLLKVSTYSLKSTRRERARMKEECLELRNIGKSLGHEEIKSIHERCRKWLNTHIQTGCFDPGML